MSASTRRRSRRRPRGLARVDWEFVGGMVIAAVAFLAFVALLLMNADSGTPPGP